MFYIHGSNHFKSVRFNFRLSLIVGSCNPWNAEGKCVIHSIADIAWQAEGVSLNHKSWTFPLCFCSWIRYRDYPPLPSFLFIPISLTFLGPWQRLSPRTAAGSRLLCRRANIAHLPKHRCSLLTVEEWSSQPCHAKQGSLPTLCHALCEASAANPAQFTS